MNPAQEKLLREINRKLDTLLGDRSKKWVAAREVMKLTGWNREQLRNKRDRGLIEYKRNKKGGIMYALDSVPVLRIA